jgi:hypothetical protein
MTDTAGLKNGDRVQFTTTGTLPAPLAVSTWYYICNLGANDFQVSDTKTTTPLNITTAGTGTHSLTQEFVVDTGEFQTFTADDPSGQTDSSGYSQEVIRPWHEVVCVVGKNAAGQYDQVKLGGRLNNQAQIGPGVYEGQILTIMGINSAGAVVIRDGNSGTPMIDMGGDCYLGYKDTLVLEWRAGHWVETGWANNSRTINRDYSAH